MLIFLNQNSINTVHGVLRCYGLYGKIEESTEGIVVVEVPNPKNNKRNGLVAELYHIKGVQSVKFQSGRRRGCP